MSTILVTGGAGFIGSHTCVELLESGYDVVVIDNLSNACEESLKRVEKITGKTLKFYEGDIADKELMDKILTENDIYAVIHFAGLKAVGESVQKPLEYYTNNISGTLAMCDVMRKHGVKNIIFSSSATVYGDPAEIPITEKCPKGQCTNPYGWTKSMLEQILTDIQFADKEWNVILLRYFNPIGAHKSGLIGEDPNGIPNNLMPYITKVATGELPRVNVFGNDYPTPDGTGVRDYIHVMDLATGHVNAIDKINADNIYVLPNNKNIILAAQQAESLVEDKNIIVIPSKTIPQGISAMIGFIPDNSPEDNKEAMIDSMSYVKTGEVTYAVRDTVIDDKEIKEGNIMGIGDEGILAVGEEIDDTTINMIKEMQDEESEIVSLYYGAEVTEEAANKLADKIAEAFPEIEVEVYPGGQPIYYYIASVE